MGHPYFKKNDTTHPMSGRHECFFSVYPVLVMGCAKLSVPVTWLLLMSSDRWRELEVQTVAKEQNSSLCESNWTTKGSSILG